MLTHTYHHYQFNIYASTMYHEVRLHESDYSILMIFIEHENSDVSSSAVSERRKSHQPNRQKVL